MTTTRAYAKINLGLRILRKREDGYHDIETVFHRINLYDEVTLEPSSTISLSCTSDEIPTDDRNLCIRAAGLLQKFLNSAAGVHITLKKNIPVGAGLGGGSSNAAAVLKSLPKWWNRPVSDEELRLLALQLGADVPYFLKPGTAYATGKGESLEYFDLDVPYWIVIVYPNLYISTTWAYQNVEIKDGKLKMKKTLTPNLKHQMALKQILLEHVHQPNVLMNLLRNDFEPLTLRTYGVVAEVKKFLYDAGAVFAQMSGSGSSVYGFFDKEAIAQSLTTELAKHYQVFMTPPHFTP